MHINESHPDKPRQRAIAISIAMLIFVTIPVVQNFREKPDDGFPCSYYPMFTKKRGEETKLIHAIAVSESGKVTNLEYRYANRGGMNQVRRQMRKMVKDGDVKNLCRTVARKARVADEPFPPGTQIQIVEDWFDISQFFKGEHDACRRTVLATVDLEQGEVQ